MTTILGNTNVSLLITASEMQLQLDYLPAITLTHGSNDIDCNGYKLINAGAAVNNEDVLTKGVADSLYASGSIGISELGPPTADVSWAGYKLTNLGNATADTDALNRQTADARYYLNTETLDNIAIPTDVLDLNSYRIVNLGTPTLTTDAVTKEYVDDNFYPDITTLDSIAAPTGDLSLNNYKITNLAAATAGTDALNRDTADARYISSTPAGDVDFNGQKLTNVAPGTASGDVFIVDQDMTRKQALLYTNSNISAGISFPYVIPFASFYRPTPFTGVAHAMTNPADGVITVSQAGTYRCDVTLQLQYDARTDKPVQVKVQRYDSGDAEIAGTSLNNVTVLSNRAPALNTKVTTSFSQLFTLQANESVKVVLTESDSSLSVIAAGSSILLSRIE